MKVILNNKSLLMLKCAENGKVALWRNMLVKFEAMFFFNNVMGFMGHKERWIGGGFRLKSGPLNYLC